VELFCLSAVYVEAVEAAMQASGGDCGSGGCYSFVNLTFCGYVLEHCEGEHPYSDIYNSGPVSLQTEYTEDRM
jgi:hypothetical protein